VWKNKTTILSRFEVLTAVIMKGYTLGYNTAVCYAFFLLHTGQDRGDMFPRNVGLLSPDYTALYPRTNNSTDSLEVGNRKMTYILVEEEDEEEEDEEERKKKKKQLLIIGSVFNEFERWFLILREEQNLHINRSERKCSRKYLGPK
jgi:hypothetical protein